MDVYNNWTYACIRAIAEELADARFRLFSIKKDGTHEEVFEHLILDLLEGVNNFQTGYELRYVTGAHLEMAGNAYWLLDGVDDRFGKPTAIYPLNPRYLKIKRGELPDPIKSYEYAMPGAKTQTYQPYQVLHLKYPDPNDIIEGIGTVQSIAQWIDADNYATEFNRRFFLNGARLGGLLESKSSLTPAQLDYLKKSFEDVFKGVDNAYKIAALPKGTKYQETGATAKDMDFMEGQRMMRDKILAGFRVPKSVLGSSEQETNRATAETANYVFALRTIKPKLRLIASYLNEFLVPRYGSDLYLEFENIVPEDRDLKIREMQASVGSQPVISVNEAREEYLGLGPVENGEDVMTDFSKIPLGAPVKSAARPSMKSSGKPAKTAHARNAKMREDVSGDIAKKAAETLAGAIKDRKTSIAQMSEEEFEPAWKGFVARVTPYERALAEAVKKFNGRQEEQVLENVGKLAKAINDNDLFDPDDWSSDLVDLAKPIVLDLFVKEAAVAAKLIGRDGMDIMTPETQNALDKAVGLIAGTYNETTLTLLKEKLEQGLLDGASQPEMKNLVKEVYEFSDAYRALQVARTETFRVANGATHEVWKQSGIVKTYRWYTAVDERVCEFCEPMMQEDPIGIDEQFFGKGETVVGSDGGTIEVDYSDIDYPPLHPNCRCYIRPVDIEI